VWRLLAGIFVGICAIVFLNIVLLVFTPVGGIPLEGATFFWEKVLGALSLLVWAAAALGVSLLACRVAGRLEGLVSLGAVVLATAVLAFVLPALSNSIAVAYLQLGSIIMSLPLLFIFYAGGLVAFFARRPDMV
jgi:hypothetical protein